MGEDVLASHDEKSCFFQGDSSYKKDTYIIMKYQRKTL